MKNLGPAKLVLLFVMLASSVVISCGDSNSPSSGGEFAGQAGCRQIETGWGPAGTDPVRLEKVVDGLEVPWGIAFLPSGGMLVTERPGRVRLIQGGRLEATPVATISTGEPGEGGLLGIAVHPNFSANRFFYVYYTFNKPSGNVNRVERYRLAEDNTQATADRIIIDDIPAGTFHDGGRLRFGPDGMLYVGTGDGRNSATSQNDDSLAGKILRLTDEGGVPGDNPVNGKAYYAKGIRNTQGFDWYDADTLAVTDHGPTGEMGLEGLDELSMVPPGANLGWPQVYGCQSGPGLVTPTFVWKEALPPGGAAFYRGSGIPGWDGNLLIGSLGSKHLQRVIFRSDGTTQNEVYFQGEFGRLREVIMGPDALYVTTSNCDGRGTCGPTKDSVLKLSVR